MRQAFFVAAMAVLIGSANRAEAKWPWGASHAAPSALPGTTGMRSWAGVPGMGGPIGPSHTQPGLSPVVGSVSRTGHFVHPITGRTKYTGAAYDPIHGRFSKYRFRE